MKELSHYELCEITAKRFSKESDVTLFEYQSYATGEFPDVLCFNGGYSKLFEIKVNYSDFKKDNKKDCRIKYKSPDYMRLEFNQFNQLKNMFSRYHFYKNRYDEYIIEKPHLGRERYYVCPKGLIKPEEVGNGWGLYWVVNRRFYLKKKSKNFRHNIHAEMNILTHAFRKYACGHGNNIIVKNYEK